MAKAPDRQAELEALEFRVRTLLPEKYEDSYEDVQPVSMGSASLKYGQDGNVAWDEMWGSFCDLAMAGGPPHKGTLLEPASQPEIDAQPDLYETVVQEICRGVDLAANLTAEPSSNPGWVRVNCVNRSTVDWLLRAITMENISVRADGLDLELPAGPSYRLEKEIKNVITVIAKTAHYWFGHIFQDKRRSIRELLAVMDAESPLLQPAFPTDESQLQSSHALKQEMSQALQLAGFRTSDHKYSGWLGIQYPGIPPAMEMMRALVASNVLSRREDSILFIPVDPVRDPTGEKAVRSLVSLDRLFRPDSTAS